MKQYLQILSKLEENIMRTSSSTIAFICDTASSQHVMTIALSLLCSHIPFDNVAEVTISRSEISNGYQYFDRRIDCSDLLAMRAFGSSDNVDREVEQTQIKHMLDTICNRCGWSPSEVQSLSVVNEHQNVSSFHRI